MREGVLVAGDDDKARRVHLELHARFCVLIEQLKGPSVDGNEGVQSLLVTGRRTVAREPPPPLHVGGITVGAYDERRGAAGTWGCFGYESGSGERRDDARRHPARVALRGARTEPASFEDRNNRAPATEGVGTREPDGAPSDNADPHLVPSLAQSEAHTARVNDPIRL